MSNNNKKTAKERNDDLTKTQEVKYSNEMNSIEVPAPPKEQTNEDNS